MILTRDKGQRMWGGGGGSSYSYGGGGGGESPSFDGFVSNDYYNQNFELLYKQEVTAGGTTTTTFMTAAPNIIVPVGTVTDETTQTTTVTSLVGPVAKNAIVLGNIMMVYDQTNNAIKVVNRDGSTAANFYATGGVSALGYNPGGGGGGADLNALLDNINSSNIGDIAPTASEVGKCLVYNGDNQWAWATPGGGGGTGTVTSITAGTGLSGGTITTSGTIAISSNYQARIALGETAYGWGNHADAGYLTSADLPALGISNGVITIGNNTITPVTQVVMTVPTGFTISGSPVTKSGTLALGFTNGYSLPTTAKQSQWDNKQDAISDLSTIRSGAAAGATAVQPSAISDMATQTWVGQQGFITASALSNYLPLTGGTLTGALHMGSSAGASPYIYWGDSSYAYIGEDSDDHITLRGDKGVNILTGSSYELEWNGDTLATQDWVEGQGYVTSSGVTSVATGTGLTGGTITTSGTISINSTYQTYISHGESAYGWGNHADQGYLLRTEGMRFADYGSYIAARFVTKAGLDDSARAAKAQGSGFIEWWASGGYFNHHVGNVEIGSGTTDTSHYIQIGGGRIYWDNTNNALYVKKEDGSACHFYSLGGISALGVGGGSSSASIDSLDVTDLSVGNTLNLNGNSIYMDGGDITDAYTIYANHLCVGNGSDISKIYWNGTYLQIKIGSSTYNFRPV